MSASDLEDMRLRLGIRPYLYQFVHTVFSGMPDESLVAALTDNVAGQSLLLAGKTPDDAYDRLRTYLVALKQADSGRIDKLRSSYIRLVDGPDLVDAYPWESMYTSHRRLLFQKSTLEVRESYREFGYKLQEQGKVPDDHISLECAFMAQMAQRTADSFAAWCDGRVPAAKPTTDTHSDLESLLDGQVRFLAEHMHVWLPRYADDLNSRDEESLYARVACMIAAFVSDDLEILSSVQALL